MEKRKTPAGFSDEYVGNFFGEKITTYGAIFIALLTAFMIYRHWALGVPFGNPDPVPVTVDSLQVVE